MRKKNKNSGKSIIITGIICVCIIIISAFYKNQIIYKYYEHITNKDYGNLTENQYFLEDHFNYTENYKSTKIDNKEELINYIYYVLNAGVNYSERYIGNDYLTYESDVNDLTKDNGKKFKEEISILNNFVHPYNSSNNIKLSYGGKYLFGITIKKAYTEKEIKEINEVVDKVIKDNITNNMPVREKIKIIHDYIINNTEYDKLKNDNIKDTTYKSQTAYGALIEGYATCNGYADSMAIFLDKLNVINYKISNDSHIWNLVYLDGKWYHLDLTWDDPISETNSKRDTYFLITTKELEKLNDGTHEYNKQIYSEAA